MMTTPLHHSLLSHQPTCHLRSDSSFSTGNLQYPPAGLHHLSPTVRIPPFLWEAPPLEETTIDPRLLTMPISHSMQHTPRTPPTTPSPTTLTTPTTPQRTLSPAPHQKSPTPMPPVRTPYQSHHDHSWRASTLWDRYIQTQGLTIPDPLYKSSTSHQHVKKPRRYMATPEERHHQEQMVLLDQPTNGRRLTRGLLGKIMAQDRKSQRGIQ